MFQTRRSIRKYTDQPIEKEKLEAIAASALFSPTAQNRRHWEFVFVQDKSMIRLISETRAHKSAFLKGAACVVIVLGDEAISDVWIEDASLAAYSIQLAAHEQGLGSCWVQIRLRSHTPEIMASEYLKNIFNIPNHLNVECLIGIGYPAESIPPHELNDDLRAKVHAERYGTRFPD